LAETLGNQGLWLQIMEIEDQQYTCSNKDQLSVTVRLIQAVLSPSYLPLLAEKQATIVLCLLCYVVGCVHKMAKPDMSMEPSMEPKITCSKIFYFPSDFRISKTFSLCRSKCS
jgi:hypothetical protein